MTWTAHPAAELFPLLDDDRLAELAEDIEVNGLLDPIWLYDDEGIGETVLLDGRNRLAACDLAGVKPETRMYEGTDPIGFVLSQNLHRRHLTTGQRAAVAAGIRPLYREQAKARQGTRTDLDPDFSKNPRRSKQPSSEAAGEQVGVSSWSVESFERVAKDRPDLAEKVKVGEVTLNSALQTVKGEAKEPTGYTRRPVEERAVQIRDMAGKGHRASQIADTLGIGVERVRALAREHEIPLPDDVIGKTHHLDPNRIVRETVNALEGLASGVNLLNGEVSELDAEHIEYWVTSLTDSLKPLNRLRRQLKEMTQ